MIASIIFFLVINLVPNIYSLCLKIILFKKYFHIKINNWYAAYDSRENDVIFEDNYNDMFHNNDRPSNDDIGDIEEINFNQQDDEYERHSNHNFHDDNNLDTIEHQPNSNEPILTSNKQCEIWRINGIESPSYIFNGEVSFISLLDVIYQSRLDSLLRINANVKDVETLISPKYIWDLIKEEFSNERANFLADKIQLNHKDENLSTKKKIALDKSLK